MKNSSTILPVLALLALGSCKKDANPAAPAPEPAAGSVLYRVTFEASWSADTHANFPAGAHFSPLIGASHRAGSAIFQAGKPASLGIKDMAERGNNAALRVEIDALRGSGLALGLLNGQASTGSPGTLADTIRLDPAHPLLTVVTMIAPSPDWFAALENENLRDNGQWASQRIVPAHAYDAGTDSGPSFIAPDQPTLPAAPVQDLQLPPATGPVPEGPPVGVWRLERIR